MHSREQNMQIVSPTYEFRKCLNKRHEVFFSGNEKENTEKNIMLVSDPHSKTSSVIFREGIIL